MALAGNIKEFGLADIFQIISLQQKTGELSVESSEGKATILVESGFIVGADATFRSIEERLQQSLVRSQTISKFQLKRATETQKKTLQPLWTVLAESGAVELNVLQTMLSQQIHETVYHILRWDEGAYRFEPKKKIEYDSSLVTPINTEFLMMEGFRITDEWSEIEQKISSFHLLLRQTSGDTEQHGKLNEAEAKVYEMLSTERTVQDLIDMSQLGEFDTCQTVYELMKKHLVEPVPGKKGRSPKIRRSAIGFTDILTKILSLVVMMALLVGIFLGLRYAPEQFVLIYKPNLSVFGKLRQSATQSYLTTFAHLLPLYYLQHHSVPKSFEELQGTGVIPSAARITDAWRQSYVIQADRETVLIQSPGADGTLKTEDDVQIVIPF